MTIQEITNRIEAIRTVADADDEKAHGMEDTLHIEVLEFIASGRCHDPAAFAKSVLATSDISFARWCA